MGIDGITDRVRLFRGAIAGVGAYLLGYLVTYLLHAGSVAERLRGFNFVVDLFGGDPIAVWQGVGWLFYRENKASASGLDPEGEADT
jgi:hypothetical protein